MKMDKVKTRIINASLYLENVLALFIIAAIIIGMTDLVKYIIMILQTNAIDTYDIFQKVLLYAIARNMLISNEGMLDFVLGIISIAGIFAIKRFLFVSNIKDNEAINIFPASVSIEDVNSSIDVKIPLDIADTVGGLIHHLSKQSCRDIHEGSYFRIADAEMKVMSYSDGVIHRVWVMKYEES